MFQHPCGPGYQKGPNKGFPDQKAKGSGLLASGVGFWVVKAVWDVGFNPNPGTLSHKP